MHKIMIASAAAIALCLPVLAQRPDSERGAQPMTKAEVEARVKDRFARMDTNRDGTVTAAEIESVRAARRAEKQDRRFAMMDTDKNGSISRAEFDAAVERRAERGGKRWARGGRGGPAAMLARADTNADGRITLEEALARPMARFATVDTNRDGTITPEERKAARDRLQEQRRSAQP